MTQDGDGAPELISGLLSLFGQEAAACCHGGAHSQRSDSLQVFFSFSQTLMGNIGTFEEDCAMYRLEPA